MKSLVLVLGDKRPAPVWGSEDYVEYERYRFRVCDYALAYLDAIQRNKRGEIPADPAARGQLITTLQAELGRRPPR